MTLHLSCPYVTKSILLAGIFLASPHIRGILKSPSCIRKIKHKTLKEKQVQTVQGKIRVSRKHTFISVLLAASLHEAQGATGQQ